MPEASAPGKLVLAGEYAVLEGAPAIATAIDVRAQALVFRVTGPESILVDPADGRKFFFVTDASGRLIWQGQTPKSRGSIVEAVFAVLCRYAPEGCPFPALSISIETGAFYSDANGTPKTKLGLGSSAAALVALTGALAKELNLAVDVNKMRQICIDAHREFQMGQGSGIDVLTALAGGVVGLKIEPGTSAREVISLPWPVGLYLVPVWSGKGSSTTELISRFYAYRDRLPESFREHTEQLARLAEQSYEAWFDQSVSGILQAIKNYDESLQALDRSAAIGINTKAHEILRQLSYRQGAVYKTSGAGGGDLGFALTDSSQTVDKLRHMFVQQGYPVLNEVLAVEGLVVED